MQTETDEAKVLWKFFYLIQEYKKFFQPLAGQRKSQHFLQFIHGYSNTPRGPTEYGKVFHY